MIVLHTNTLTTGPYRWMHLTKDETEIPHVLDLSRVCMHARASVPYGCVHAQTIKVGSVI